MPGLKMIGGERTHSYIDEKSFAIILKISDTIKNKQKKNSIRYL